MGRVLPPVDINKESLIGELKKRIEKINNDDDDNKCVVVLVYANWCGHCHVYKPKFTKMINNPNRAVEAAMVEDTQWNQIKSSMNIKNAEIEGYPSVIAINKNFEAVNFQGENGESSNTVPDHNNTKMMNSIIENGLPATVNENSKELSKSTNVSRPYNSQMNENMSNAIQNMPAEDEGSTLPPNTLEDSIQGSMVVNNKKQGDSLVYKPVPKPAANPLTGGSRCGCALSGFKGLTGGSGLYGLLSSVASEAATPTLLLGTAAYLSKRSKKTRKVSKRKIRQTKRTSKRTSK